MSGPEQAVRELFGRLLTESTPENRASIITQIVDVISAPDYRDGSLWSLIHGGIVDDGVTGLPTGMMPVASLRDLHHKYSEVDWSTLSSLGEGIMPVRLAYAARVMSEAFARRSWEPLPIGEHSLSVLHLNTYRQIPLFSEFARTGVEAQTLTSYALPAIYVSRLDPIGDGTTFRLSPCSEDIIRDRASHDLQYDRGLVYSLDPARVFQVDRRANIKYQNFFIRRATARHGSYEPAIDALSTHSQKLVEARELCAGLDLPRFESIALIARDLRFSVLGFCLFEAIHEYAMLHLDQVNQANGLLTTLDPSQATHWSMRGFNVGSTEHRVECLERYRGTGISHEGFLQYLHDTLAYKLAAFLGDGHELAEECAYNSIFQFRWHEIELADSEAEFQSIRCESDRVPLATTLPSGVSLDRHRGRLVFDLLTIDDQLAQDLHRVLDAHLGEEWVRSAVDEQRYKRCYLTFREALGANSIRVLLAHDLGPLGVPFQPDPRGELLLIPILPIDQQAERAVIDRREGELTVEYVRPREKVSAPVFLRDVGVVDPLLRAAPFALYGRRPTNAAAYSEVYSQVRMEIDSSLEAALASHPLPSSAVAVVIPFYKEADSYLRIIRDVMATGLQSDGTIIFVMVTNQPRDQFLRNMAAIETSVLRLVNESGTSAFSLAVNTERVSSISHWMIEKFLNVHAGSYVCSEMLAMGWPVTNVAYLEGDLQNVSPWWAALAEEAEASPPSSVVLFDHEVLTRPEAELSKDIVGQHPSFDTSDAILAKLVAGPLTEVIFGSPIEQLFGGNFMLSASAMQRFTELLDRSLHAESLVEVWLSMLLAEPDARCRVRRVPPKVHLPAVSSDYSTTNKTLKWVADLLYSMESYLFAAGGQSERAEILSDGTFPTIFHLDDTPEMEWRRGHLADRDYLQHVWRSVLSDELSAKHERMLDALGGLGDLRSTFEAVSDDDWCETLVAFLLHARAKRADEPEELASLTFLLDARILAMFVLKRTEVTVRPTEECLTRLRGTIAARLVAIQR